MDLKKMTEPKFLCDGARTDNVENPYAFDLGLQLIEELGHQFLRALSLGYELHQLGGQQGDIILVKANEVVGFYLSDSLALHPDHQGKGLSTPLILAAVPYRLPPIKRTVSKAGEKALRKAWRVANGLACNPWIARSKPAYYWCIIRNHARSSIRFLIGRS